MGAYAGPTDSWIYNTKSGGLHRLVTNGLVLLLDAANTVSYPGSGITWTDLSDNGNTGELVNTPTFSSENRGILTFNGTNEFVDFASDSNLLPTAGLTVSAWFKTTVADRWLLMKASGTGLTDGYKIIGNADGTMLFAVNNINVGSLSTITTGAWINIVGTWIPSTSLRIYLNGSQVNINTTSIPASITNPSTNLEIARRVGTSDWWNGSIAHVSIYDRALTATEVLQNYNALNGRFGI